MLTTFSDMVALEQVGVLHLFPWRRQPIPTAHYKSAPLYCFSNQILRFLEARFSLLSVSISTV